MKRKCSLPPLVLFILIFFCTHCSHAPTREITILHFNDVYEISPTENNTVGGAARVATLIKGLQDQNPLILFSGDAFGGGSVSNYYKGKQMVDVFNRLGLDYAVCGNHEFDYNISDSVTRFKESRFTWFCANILVQDQPITGTQKATLVDWNGVKVGILGLASDWREAVMNSDKIQYSDYLTVARELVTELKAQGAEIIIALTHMRFLDDQNLLHEIPQIDLVLGGHDHEFIEDWTDNRLIWKTGMNWRHVGEIKITLDPQKNKKITARNIPINDSLTADPEMTEIVASYVGQFDKSLAKLIGATAVALDARQKTVRLQESNLGNFIADVLRKRAHTDVALMNGGGIRTDSIIPAGPLTLKDIYAVLPFDNHVVSLELTGEEILTALENGFSHYPEQSGASPHLSGLQVTIDPAKPPGLRVEKVFINHLPLDKTKKYTLATNNFLTSGGNDYHIFKSKPLIMDVNTGPLVYAAVVQEIAAQKTIAPQIENRIVFKKTPSE